MSKILSVVSLQYEIRVIKQQELESSFHSQWGSALSDGLIQLWTDLFVICFDKLVFHKHEILQAVPPSKMLLNSVSKESCISGPQLHLAVLV